MSRTDKHKIKAKFNNGLVDIKDIPINIRKMWDRHNFDKGSLKALRLKKYLKSLVDIDNV